jgi:hypothetical protein
MFAGRQTAAVTYHLVGHTRRGLRRELSFRDFGFAYSGQLNSYLLRRVVVRRQDSVVAVRPGGTAALAQVGAAWNRRHAGRDPLRSLALSVRTVPVAATKSASTRRVLATAVE